MLAASSHVAKQSAEPLVGGIQDCQTNASDAGTWPRLAFIGCFAEVLEILCTLQVLVCGRQRDLMLCMKHVPLVLLVLLEASVQHKVW